MRYLILLLFVLANIFAFFLPKATIYSAFFIISLFSNATLTNNVINLHGANIDLAAACIAISAYYLLLILNLSTPMPLGKRIYSLMLSFSLLFIINTLRITLFSFLFVSLQPVFSALHFMTWFIFSSVLVFLVWYANIIFFNVKEIPVYSDLKFLIKSIRNK
jgi:exosortase/archaeosortase family protein